MRCLQQRIITKRGLFINYSNIYIWANLEGPLKPVNLGHVALVYNITMQRGRTQLHYTQRKLYCCMHHSPSPRPSLPTATVDDYKRPILINNPN